jgi:hypothetical protein
MAILFIIAYHGEYFLPEYPDRIDEVDGFKIYYKYAGYTIDDTEFDPKMEKLVRSGRERTYDGKEEDYPHLAHEITYSRHFTILFNAFVML